MEIAFERDASDIHIDPEENIVLIQIRVDGILETRPQAAQGAPQPDRQPLQSALAKWISPSAAWPRTAASSNASARSKRRIHMRAAILPTTHGERLTLRLLAVETEQLTLNRLGMSEMALRTFATYAAQPQGMILLSGPTGAGKSTTLYAALRHRLAHHPGRFITVEEPVEFDIVGVAQIEVDTADKVRFDTVLRNILRSDPDVIMIGEIRDLDSADMAIKAALTGHLVFSSIHTNSAAGVVTRLIDMGLEPFQVAATVRLCIAQRLARRLCPECRKPRKLTSGRSRRGRPTRSRRSNRLRTGRLRKVQRPRLPRPHRTVRTAADRRRPGSPNRRRRERRRDQPPRPRTQDPQPPRRCRRQTARRRHQLRRNHRRLGLVSLEPRQPRISQTIIATNGTPSANPIVNDGDRLMNSSNRDRPL